MASSSPSSGSSKGKGKGKGRSTAGVATLASRWKRRTLFNFAVGRSSLRALPVVIHLLSGDLDWFGQDSSLFDELKGLLRDRVISITADGDADPEAPRSRKRARKEEVCVQGERLQFTYRYRNTCPRYTVLSYADDDPKVEETAAGDSSKTASGDKKKAGGKGSSSGAAGGKKKGSASGGPGFHHLPLSQSTLLVWVYRFDVDDPYRPVPNAAALQFAPPAPPSTEQPLDVEAFARDSRTGVGTTGVQAGPRDAGLLSWLWGPDGGDGEGGGGGGRVRQHFVGSAAWQGRPGGAATERRGRGGEEEEEDIQKAIALSLAAEGGKGGGAGEQDLLEVLDDEE